MSESELIIGLECHVQLSKLKTKLFCGCSADYRDLEPNTVVCPTCLGLPGALPVINREAINLGLKVAKALNCKISDKIIFFRKNYYYPDMPKNFQISQYDRVGGIPLGRDGYIKIKTDSGMKSIRIRRIHLEEDPAKIVYLGSISTSPYSLIDYNRAGVALLEIVTEPDLTSDEEAHMFLKKLRSIVEHLGVSDGSLQGSMRCDVNISLRGGKRVEIKNISSFKEVKKAINYEFLRQKQLLKRGVTVEQETRHWDEVRKITVSMRSKETEQDYRYFPEPDLVPIHISAEWLNKVLANLPELPEARKTRFISQYGLPVHDAEVLTSSKALADFFEAAAKLYKNYKVISNWMMGDLLRNLNELDIEISESKITPELLVSMLKLIDEGVISGKLGKIIIRDIIQTGKDPRILVEEKNIVKIASEEELTSFINQVFQEYPAAVKDALKDEKAIHYLIGQVMKKTAGRADPELLNKLVRKKLAEISSEKF
ncbi:MAG: Asp-tRNA(Asn)/Glu-tRNA(Gln) amidotransferase subunit GatB [Candidatus Odinarchaeum yellowstonii]|uniref:Aspartyl/glutamyl-tRNA(Asn/Gln) amidotransferase subunit B n=1 Tax=Odinarchaeota yellowstonii (strain LCB_4) TaxID=1841599 RepID=A0AAF0D103_ODILC|nr:MAG: Asp-tRNA(Asn)/Glu-tRNA(Gln) amidotransferase subunit GatB [Candidatus Odinarchaeum yellowstonii]